MELLFLGLLLLLMMLALTAGFPVAFALPGSAIITIALAAASGHIFAGDVSAYFAQDGPVQWLSAGVTNFRSLYWLVERDTLIAIPLFIFMGIMLQRSKIAEDLLVAMAQLFGPVPGGLGVSVVFVGALLAATTGIVGATVIAMGLISLPAMLRNNYSKSLACGTICASGTLGQIIPPSIVLIILADQLANAADQANTARKELYRVATGEFSMPSQFDVVSASAGDMFMGAMIPGVVLVGIYMLYILIAARINPELAPPVPYEGDYDSKFAGRVFLALVPPLTLIFVVLGSIITGVATVNQAGSIGAIGAMIMAGYRLYEGNSNRYTPAIIALLATIAIFFIVRTNDINIKSIQNADQQFWVNTVSVAVIFLLIAIVWSGWRAYKISDTLQEVMIETAKTTSMVFIILIGAAMLTSAFRAFGGEELVKEFLTSLPGGFWTQFLVVMLVIFLLGFFLDFIEIAVVVVPIVAPILLANPEANVTAVWLGVMIGLNIQTSFLTPPFGFALFYLRGVADKVIETIDIYKGAAAFIVLQLIGLAIVGYFPSLVNYLPNRTHLLSDTAPPPMNPKLQLCLEDYAQGQYANSGAGPAIEKAMSLDVSYLPVSVQEKLIESLSQAKQAPSLMAAIVEAKVTVEAYTPTYKPIHQHTRQIERDIFSDQNNIKRLNAEIKNLSYGDEDNSEMVAEHQTHIGELEISIAALEITIPDAWAGANQQYTGLNSQLTKARRTYYNAVDTSNEALADLVAIIEDAPKLDSIPAHYPELHLKILNDPTDSAMAAIKVVEKELGDIKGASSIKSKLSKARRILKKGEDATARSAAIAKLDEMKAELQNEIQWRKKAKVNLLPDLITYKNAISTTIGLRGNSALTEVQAKFTASCLSGHRDISLNF
ncbi:MAG: tripartite ATP-independent transporter DctM subunit [Saprospiraceae bacterium]|jgi:tripartite ATP-independent transporter DctM subunit